MGEFIRDLLKTWFTLVTVVWVVYFVVSTVGMVM